MNVPVHTRLGHLIFTLTEYHISFTINRLSTKTCSFHRKEGLRFPHIFILTVNNASIIPHIKNQKTVMRIYDQSEYCPEFIRAGPFTANSCHVLTFPVINKDFMSLLINHKDSLL